MMESRVSPAYYGKIDLACVRMEKHAYLEFEIRVPTPSSGVVACEGVLHSSWNTKCVTLTNKTRNDIAKDISHKVDSILVIDTDKLFSAMIPLRFELRNQCAKRRSRPCRCGQCNLDIYVESTLMEIAY
jgi:hypothetical protein